MVGNGDASTLEHCGAEPREHGSKAAEAWSSFGRQALRPAGSGAHAAM